MRPEGWENPYIKTIPHSSGQSAYEAGADAMLEGLKKDALYSNTEECMEVKAGVKAIEALDMTSNRKGWLVFIPKEKE